MQPLPLRNIYCKKTVVNPILFPDLRSLCEAEERPRIIKSEQRPRRKVSAFFHGQWIFEKIGFATEADRGFFISKKNKNYANLPKKDEPGRRFLIMKSFSAVLIGRAIILSVFSCATVSKEPLAPGELRLLSMDAVGSGVEANSSFAVNFFWGSRSPGDQKGLFL